MAVLIDKSGLAIKGQHCESQSNVSEVLSEILNPSSICRAGTSTAATNPHGLGSAM